MHLDFEYGNGMLGAELPDTTDVFVTGETVKDPECLPQDWDSLYNATLESIRNPIGMEPLASYAGPGKKVVIVIPDIVKGGTQPTAHRKVAIRACLDELFAHGVKHDDVLLLFSNGLHPRTSTAEAKLILGLDLYNEFEGTGQITSHDSEDYDHLVDLGFTPQGDHVIMNKYVYDADIAILIGHTQGNPYGGYSGGYKHCATGITHWRSISAHHVPRVMSRPDFVPVSTSSLMRDKFDQQGMFMEEKMGKKFFCVDAVLDTWSRQIAIFSGYAAEMQPISWALADKRTYVHWAEKKYDIVVMGMPTNFHYGDGMGTNPIQMMQAVSAQVIRHKRILSDHCVFVIASYCNGWFHDERWPYLREQWELWQSDKMKHARRDDRVRRVLRHQRGVHPQVPLRPCVPSVPRLQHDDLRQPGREVPLRHLYRGAQKPGIARTMGLKTRPTSRRPSPTPRASTPTATPTSWRCRMRTTAPCRIFA